MNGFDGDATIARMAAATTADERFEALTSGVASLGLDVVNYGFFDLQAASLVDADILFLTTMSEDWMAHYYDSGLARTDVHVTRLRAKKMTPYVWTESAVARIEDAERSTALQAAEAGLRSALCVPLASPLDPFTPVAAINLGSSMGEAAFGQVLREHGATLTTLAHLLHNASIRQLWQGLAGPRSLTVRERDCLSYLAEGRRQDAIAEALGLARVTVEAHLRSARHKLGARTLAEAVAKAVVFGDVRRG